MSKPINSVVSKVISVLGLLALMSPLNVTAQSDEITFHKDIEPILQRSCQNCHRVGGVGPMPLVTYDQVAPFAGLIEYKTGLRDRAGAMPPWYMEKDIGIQDYKNDPSLNDKEIVAISTWARSGTPKGDIADAPEPLVFDDSLKWTAGEPDLIVRTNSVTKLAGTADWWGEIDRVPVSLEQDRYVKSVEVVEVNDVNNTTGTGRDTVGGRYIFHHMIWSTAELDEDGNRVEESVTGWPVHEVGRNPDIFDPEGGRLLRAGTYIYSDSVHLHSNGQDTTGHLEIGFRFHPEGYEPKYERVSLGLGNGVDISIAGNQDNQELHAYTVLNNTLSSSLLNHTYTLRASACVLKQSGDTQSKHWPVLVTTITGFVVMPLKTMPRHCCLRAQSCTL